MTKLNRSCFVLSPFASNFLGKKKNEKEKLKIDGLWKGLSRKGKTKDLIRPNCLRKTEPKRITTTEGLTRCFRSGFLVLELKKSKLENKGE